MQETCRVCEGSKERKRGINVAHRNREDSGQREDAQQSLSGSLSAQSGEKANIGKEKSTGLNRFMIVCKAYVAKTPLPKGSGNSSNLVHFSQHIHCIYT